MTKGAAATEHAPMIGREGSSASICRVDRSAARLLASLVREPLTSLPDECFDHGMVVTRAIGRTRAYVTGPDLVQEIFVRHADALGKGTQGSVLAPALGTGLLTAEGQDWRWQRRTLAPGFAHARLQGLVPAMIAAAEAARDTLLAAPGEAATDIGPLMARTTLRIVGDTMLACAGGLDPARVERGIADFLSAAPWAIALAILRAPAWLPHPGRARSARAARQIREEIVAAVAQRRAAGAAADDDLMALLLAARDPNDGRAFTDAEVTDNVVTFVMAGHETTSVALTWALHLLSRHPDVAAAVRAEVETIVGAGPLGADHVPRLAYTRQLINETMRLYPPAPITSRITTRRLDVGGVDLPGGSVIILPIYAVHRHRALWDRPDAFDPDRFAPEQARVRHRYAFLPFGVGPRICIGSAFAVLEATAILAVLVRALDFAPAGPAPAPMARVTLRPRTPVLLRATAAEGRAAA